MPPKRASSPSSTPVPSTEANPGDASSLPEQEWDAMQDILNHVYDYRTTDDHDPSKVFHRKVNKRAIPAYYDVIKEPMAMSTIKGKINAHEYKHFSEFVRDWALISHNAQVYNRPDAGAYQDALIIKSLVETELQKLVERKIVTEDIAKLPYLGEIPPQDELVPDEDEEEEDDEEEDDDVEGEADGDGDGDGEGDEGEETDEEGNKRKKRRGPRAKRDKGDDKKDDDPETRKKRGRPPKVLTPTEARIQAVLKGIRKPKNSQKQLMVGHFERLPDKAVMPEYFNEIKNPMAFDVLKRKLKRKKYQSLEQFMKDVDLMFENAKSYNQDESQIYQDAVELQAEAQRLAAEETAKPDSDYVMEEGRIPLPNGIIHNGEHYKVGDWVHIQNVNDLTKPIPTQIYRTWQDSDGGQWVNVCWYYRPEQTVHRFDKHFLENEVVKTGQYRDHRIDEIVDRCFIMFVTRYYKGRPRGLPPDMDIYVCEARYNEEKFKFNKIKTWASCLPDEVRDKDYEMYIFDAIRKIKKVPSPIAYLLKEDAKETDEMPKPEWGAENAPPKIGAVHKRPRDPKDSPPPEPTPSPPPQQPTPAPPIHQTSHMSPPAPTNYSPMPAAVIPSAAPLAAPSPARPPPIPRTSQTPAQPQQYAQMTNTPAPALSRAFSGQSAALPPATPQQAPTAPMPRTVTHPSAYAGAQIPPPPSVSYLGQSRPSTSSYKEPHPTEVWTLPDAANAGIPPEIRSQFQQDEAGRVLFFTAPPIQVAEPNKSAGKALGHSVRYLAQKFRSEEETAKKRKLFQAAKAEAQQAKKKQKLADAAALQQELDKLQAQAFETLQSQLTQNLQGDMSALYGDDWRSKYGADLNTLAQVQKLALERRKVVESNQSGYVARYSVPLGSAGTLLDGDE
ncbi:hypothetical protein MBLNU459_g6727t1 [Dothideomycetes sp. NU459]